MGLDFGALVSTQRPKSGFCPWIFRNWRHEAFNPEIVTKWKSEHLHHWENRKGRDSLEMGWFSGEVAMKTVERKPHYFAKKLVQTMTLWCFCTLQLYTSKKSKCTLTDGPGTQKFVKRWWEKLKKHWTPFLNKWKVTKLKISQTGFKANTLVNFTWICFHFWNFNNEAKNIFAIQDRKPDKNMRKYFIEKVTLQKLGKNWGFVHLSHCRWIWLP